MKLYKYYGENQIRKERAFNDKGLSVYFSKLSEFNDPFEGRLNIKNLILFEADKQSKHQLNKLGSKHRKTIEEVTEKKTKELLKEHTRFEESLIYKMEEFTGILCLTKKPKNKLMWSHYADSYKGICIEFDFDESIPCNLENKIYKIKYQDHRLIYPIGMENNLEYFQKFAIDAVTTKDLIWSYEEEFRLLAKIEDRSDYSGTTISPTNITKIIFGANCKKTSIDFINKWISKHNAIHIQLSRIALDLETYDLFIEDL